jgi:hypothetical protein
MRIALVAASVVAFGLLAGCQPTPKPETSAGPGQSNSGHPIAITRDQLTFQIDIPEGANTTFRHDDKPASSGISEYAYWDTPAGFAHVVRRYPGAGQQYSIRYRDPQVIAKFMSWGNMDGLNGDASAGDVRVLDSGKSWVATLSQLKSTGLICLSGLYLADRDLGSGALNMQDDSSGVTDAVSVFSCGNARNTAAFTSGFESLIRSIRIIY